MADIDRDLLDPTEAESEEEEEEEERPRRGADLARLADGIRYAPVEMKILAAVIAAAVVAPLVTYGYMHTKAKHELAMAASDRRQAMALQRPISTGRAVLLHSARYLAKERRLTAAMPAEPDVTSIVSTIYQLATTDNISAPSISQSPPSSSATGATVGEVTVQVSLTVTGTPLRIEKFVDRLRYEPRIMTVSQLSMSYGAKGTATAPLVLLAYTGQKPPPLR
jgi:Tfp pilus assembly protein PilO